MTKLLPLFAFGAAIVAGEAAASGSLADRLKASQAEGADVLLIDTSSQGGRRTSAKITAVGADFFCAEYMFSVAGTAPAPAYRCYPFTAVVWYNWSPSSSGTSVVGLLAN